MYLKFCIDRYRGTSETYRRNRNHILPAITRKYVAAAAVMAAAARTPTTNRTFLTTRVPVLPPTNAPWTPGLVPSLAAVVGETALLPWYAWRGAGFCEGAAVLAGGAGSTWFSLEFVLELGYFMVVVAAGCLLVFPPFDHRSMTSPGLWCFLCDCTRLIWCNFVSAPSKSYSEVEQWQVSTPA